MRNTQESGVATTYRKNGLVGFCQRQDYGCKRFETLSLFQTFQIEFFILWPTQVNQSHQT